MSFLAVHWLGIVVGYCLCVLVPIPFLERWIRSAWFKLWAVVWDHTMQPLLNLIVRR